MNTIVNQPKKHQTQQGAASIEFSLSLMVFFLIFFGLISFGTLFWVQQKLSYAAGEGARVLFHDSIYDKNKINMPDGWLNPNQEGSVCQHALNTSDFLKNETQCHTVIRQCQPIGAANSPLQYCDISVVLIYNTKNNPLLHSVGWISQFFKNNETELMPHQLAAQSTVKIQVRSLEPKP